MKALISACIGCGFEVVVGLSLELDPLWAGVFNVLVSVRDPQDTPQGRKKT